MTYRIEITAQAQADAEAAYGWIAAHYSPKQAGLWYQELFTQIEALADHPERCPLADENDAFPQEIRALIYGKRANRYRIIYSIRDMTVVVLYIYHGRRKRLES